MRVAIVIWDGVELLDFTGPGQVFGAAAKWAPIEVYTVAAGVDPIVSRGFLKVIPQYTFSNCPVPNILVIPGGGVNGPLSDPSTVGWINRTVHEADLVLSVCTGAFLLAQGGHLDGLSATTWHDSIERLAEVAPKTKVVRQRFVDNGKIVTAAGVSSGIDASLHVVRRVFGDDVADKTSKYMEYPRPDSAPQ